MTAILCQWLNDQLGLSQRVEPSTFAREFSTGYLIGEILNKHQLQDDFDQFSKGRNSISQLNNFQRLLPTLQLLGVLISDTVVRAVVQEEAGVATRLLYQIYIALRRKEKAQLSKLALETTRPPAAAKLANISNKMYKERLKTMIPRQVDVILQNVSKHFVALGNEMKEQQRQREEEVHKQQNNLEQQRLDSLETLRVAKKKNEELMAKIQAGMMHLPKPAPKHVGRSMKKRKEELKKKEAAMFTKEIRDFETILKKLEPIGAEKDHERPSAELDLLEQPPPPKETSTQCTRMGESQGFLATLRMRLDAEAKARKEREKRRRRVILEQLQAHEAQEEVYREEQLVNRLMRQSLQERRIAVQLMHARHEKQIIVQNRIFREKQYEEKRLQEFLEVLDKEAVLAREEKREHMEQIQQQREMHEWKMAERAEERFRKHYTLCWEVVEHIIDLATKIAEYRELTLSLIPWKLMREWKEMFFHELPLYGQQITEPQTSEEVSVSAQELEAQEMLNAQDYEDYRMMTGEWLPPEEGDVRGPPPNNNVLGHVVRRIFEMVNPTKPPTPPPVFPPFPIKASILGKLLAGKSTCLQYLTEALHIQDLVPDVLVREAVRAFEEGETIDMDQAQEDGVESVKDDQTLEAVSINHAPSELVGFSVPKAQEVAGSALPSSSKDRISVQSKNAPREPTADQTEQVLQDSTALSKDEQSLEDEIVEVTDSQTSISRRTTIPLSRRAQLGGRAAKLLQKGKSIPDELLVEILCDCIQSLPAECGWILDGFPVTIKQAKLLEKWLTGFDPDKANNKSKKSKTSLVIDTRAPKDSPPPHPALDIVILLDVSDNTVLARYSERTAPVSLDSETESRKTDIVHSDSKGNVTDSSTTEEEQVLPRLIGFHDNWPKLERWFEEKQKILVKVNGEVEQEELLEKLENILVGTLYKKQCEDAAVEQPDEVRVLPSPVQVEPAPSLELQKSSKEGKSVRNGSVNAVDPTKEKRKMSMSPQDKKRDKSGSKAQLGSVKGKKTKGKLEPTPEPSPEAEPQRPPQPKPGSDQWIYVDEKLPQEVAEYLAPYWSNIENTYINTIRSMMQEERDEKHRIIIYLYNIRQDFHEYLTSRPDHKQEFVSQWQDDYNSIAEDLRHDDEVKAELLLRLYDLRECLWDISDNRKEEAEKERMSIVGNGWLDDHLGLLLNIYSTLMQAEVDRFEDTYRFLQDYYGVMQGNIPPEDSKEFTRIPLVNVNDPQLPVSEPVIIEESGSVADSSQGDRQTKQDRSTPVMEGKEDQKVENGARETASGSSQVIRQTPLESSSRGTESKEEQKKDQDQETKEFTVPLVPYRIPSSSLEVKEKAKSIMRVPGKMKDEVPMTEVPPPLTDVDEYLIFTAHQMATSAVSSIILKVVRNKEEEERKEQKLKEEKEKELQKSAGKEPKKKGVKSADKKKGQQSFTPSLTLPILENPELVRKRELKERIFTEYIGALEDEAQAVRIRLELIRLKAMSVVQELKLKAQEVFTFMEDWLGSRFLQEMESINSLLDVGLGHVNAGTKIEHQLILHSKEFFVNGDVKMVPDPPPLTRLPSKEIAKDGELTIDQLCNLHRQFMLVAPTGFMLKKTFIEILHDLVSLDLSLEQLPEQWSSISYSQVLDITRTLTQESDLLDWRRFLLAAAQPWPYPSLSDLLDTKSRFQAFDEAETGYVTQEQYNQVDLWFKVETEPQEPEDPEAPLPFQRLKQLKQIFFTVFADESRQPPELDYTNMLLYFAAHRDPVQGFHRSLSLAAGTDLTSNPDTPSTIVKSEHCIDRQTTGRDSVAPDEDDVISSSDGLVPIYAVFQILTHGVVKSEDTHRHSKQYETEQLFCKNLTDIYQQLGSKDFEAVPFTILLRHPFIMELVKSTLKFTLPDFKAILQRKPVESEAVANSSPELSVETSSNTPTEDLGGSRKRVVKT